MDLTISVKDCSNKAKVVSSINIYFLYPGKVRYFSLGYLLPMQKERTSLEVLSFAYTSMMIGRIMGLRFIF